MLNEDGTTLEFDCTWFLLFLIIGNLSVTTPVRLTEI